MLQTRIRLALKALIPSRRVIVLLVAAIVLLLIGSMCALAFEWSGRGQGETPGVRALGASMFYMPVVALVLVIAALMAKRPAPRALVWLMLVALVAVGGLMLALAMTLDPDAGIGLGAASFAIFCAPVALVPFLPGIYYGLKAWPDIKEAMREARQARIIEVLSDQGGIVRASDLVQQLALAEEKVTALIQDAVDGDQLDGVFYPTYGLLYARTALAGQQRRLIGIVRARGQVQVDELARDLGVPLSLLKEWLYELVQRGRFSGYINWDDGLLYSAEAQALRQMSVCPRCSGQLSLAGKGVIECQYCGAEIFLDR